MVGEACIIKHKSVFYKMPVTRLSRDNDGTQRQTWGWWLPSIIFAFLCFDLLLQSGIDLQIRAFGWPQAQALKNARGNGGLVHVDISPHLVPSVLSQTVNVTGRLLKVWQTLYSILSILFVSSLKDLVMLVSLQREVARMLTRRTAHGLQLLRSSSNLRPTVESLWLCCTAPRWEFCTNEKQGDAGTEPRHQ